MKQSLATTNQETVDGESGLKIFFRSWHPDDTAHAIVVIVPGLPWMARSVIWLQG
jgi:acylglycerol lipase